MGQTLRIIKDRITWFINYTDLFGTIKQRRCRMLGITKTTYNRCPIFKAIFDNDLDTVKRLIDAGENVNIFVDKPIHAALHCGNYEIVKTLVEAGAIIDFGFSTNVFDHHARCVISSGNLDTLKYMMQISKNDCFKPDQVFLEAVNYGQLEMIKYAVSLGAKFNYHDPILFAYIHRYNDVTKYLLSIGLWSCIICPYDYIGSLTERHLEVIDDPGVQRYIKYRMRTRVYSPVFSDIDIVTEDRE